MRKKVEANNGKWLDNVSLTSDSLLFAFELLIYV